MIENDTSWCLPRLAEFVSLTWTRLNNRYDNIGHGYARTRREEPKFGQLIIAALGNARSVLNVMAGTGSYEPRDRASDGVPQPSPTALPHAPNSASCERGHLPSA
jgi:hypothetical protein